MGEKDRRVDSTTGFPRGLDLVLPLLALILLPCTLVDSKTGAPRGFLDLFLFRTGLGGSSWKGGEASWSTACSVALLHSWVEALADRRCGEGEGVWGLPGLPVVSRLLLCFSSTFVKLDGLLRLVLEDIGLFAVSLTP